MLHQSSLLPLFAKHPTGTNHCRSDATQRGPRESSHPGWPPWINISWITTPSIYADAAIIRKSSHAPYPNCPPWTCSPACNIRDASWMELGVVFALPDASSGHGTIYLFVPLLRTQGPARTDRMARPSTSFYIARHRVHPSRSVGESETSSRECAELLFE